MGQQVFVQSLQLFDPCGRDIYGQGTETAIGTVADLNAFNIAFRRMNTHNLQYNLDLIILTMTENFYRIVSAGEFNFWSFRLTHVYGLSVHQSLIWL